MLRVIDLGIDFGDRTLFDGASFGIAEGEKVGIVGPNGCGKTTLLKIIAGAISADRGVVDFAGNPSLALLPQHVLDFGPITAGELLAPVFVAARGELSRILKELEERFASPTNRPSDPDLLREYNLAYEQFEAAGGYAFETTLDLLLRELGMSTVDLSCQLTNLSGGQLTKLALARVLLQDADFLLLDEPTNNLDVSSLLWLENALRNCRSACLIVSHDRKFLDEVTTRTLVIDPLSGSIADYGGNYSFYRLRKQQEIERQWRTYEIQQRKIRRLTEDVREVKQQAEATENSTVNDYLRGRSKKVAAKAKARETRLLKMIEDEQIEKPRNGETMRLRLEGRRQYDSPLIVARDVSYAFDEKPNTVLAQSSFEVIGSTRILLSGDNGCGKSTLLRLITGEITPTSGTICVKPAIKICYLPQQQESLPESMNALDFFRSQVLSQQNAAKMALAVNSDRGSRQNSEWLRDGAVRTFLHRFQFAGDKVFEPVSRLSRGERTKLILATIMAINPDVLILDEPTNHLDLPSVELLEDALGQFKGALLFVSHDRHFVDRLRPHVNWYLQNGNIRHSFMNADPTDG